MNEPARDLFADTALTRRDKPSDAPSSGFRIAAARDLGAAHEQPVFDLLQRFEVDHLESPLATLILIDLPGVPLEHVSLMLGRGALQVRVRIAPTPAPLRIWPPGMYEARFEVSANVEAEAIDALVDNGLLKICIAKQSVVPARVEIASVTDEVIWLD